jgi:inner membrane protein
LLFAAALAFLLTTLYEWLRSSRGTIYWVCFISCPSHALLDSLANGGLGVALFWPLRDSRFFFPFRPIDVSPIGIANFFTASGLAVIASEFRWVILTGLIICSLALLVRRSHAK